MMMSQRIRIGLAHYSHLYFDTLRSKVRTNVLGTQDSEVRSGVLPVVHRLEKSTTDVPEYAPCTP